MIRAEGELDKERKSGKASEKARASLDRSLKDLQVKLEEAEEAAARDIKRSVAKMEAEVSKGGKEGC